MIVRFMDRFYARRPRTALAIAIIAAAMLLYVSSDWDKAETASIRLQMWAERGAM